MDRPIRWYDYITLNIFWFGKTTRNQALSTLIIPLLVQQFVGNNLKGTYLGVIRLGGLMVALLVQSLMGMISDHSTLTWGRRRPFILIGTIFEIFVLIVIGFIAGMEETTGYWLLFSFYLLSMIGSDTGQGAAQGFITDLAPQDRYGQFSGIKAFLELPLPLIFASFVVSKMVSRGDYWGALIVVVITISICMMITMFVPEKPLQNNLDKLDWHPFLRLALMTVVFTLIILGMGTFLKLVISFTANNSFLIRYVTVGAIGLSSMILTIIFGVLICISIGLGQKTKPHITFTCWVMNKLAFLVGATNLSGFMIYFLQERFEQLDGSKAAGPASILVMLVGLSILLSTIPSGWLTDKFGHKPLIVFASIAATAGTLVSLLSPIMNMIYIGGCLIGLGIGVFYTASWALGMKIVPKQDAGKYLGISNLASAGAGAVGAYFGGPIADAIGYIPLFIIYGSLFILSTLVLKWIKP